MAIDNKYGQVTVEHGSIGEDEPVFVIRAKDEAAVDAIMDYFDTARTHGAVFSNDVRDEVIGQFMAWREANFSLVRAPD